LLEFFPRESAVRGARFGYAVCCLQGTHPDLLAGGTTKARRGGGMERRCGLVTVSALQTPEDKTAQALQ